MKIKVTRRYTKLVIKLGVVAGRFWSVVALLLWSTEEANAAYRDCLLRHRADYCQTLDFP